MSVNDGPPPGTLYFFLSYAHTAPLAGAVAEPFDYEVKQVFDDLSGAVRRVARLGPDTRVGFFDGLIEAGADWKSRTTAELGLAEVFVPLYSPRYFSMSWPGREWACFGERLTEEPADAPSAHIVPVLWVPLAGAVGPANGPDPLSIVNDVPEYAENGLRALKMLNLYNHEYHAVIARLAEKIVETVRESPLGPSRVSPLHQVASAFRHKSDEDDFVVAVAAPTRSTVPLGRTDSWYGDESTHWRPFGEHEQLDIAEYAVTVAERLDFSTAVRAVGSAADYIATTPAVVLIDPWIAESVKGSESEALRGLRELYSGKRQRLWALPVLALNASDPQSKSRQTQLTGQLMRILREIGVEPVEAGRGGVVTSIDEFAQLLPALVADAERRFLRHGMNPLNHPSGGGRPGTGAVAPSPDSDARERPDG